MASREQLEDWVERWLQANRDAEAAGDWKPLADFYTDDATYGWNIGPKEDVMCVNKDEIRDVALGLEMEGLENWVYEYQKVLIDEKQNEIVGFWKHGIKFFSKSGKLLTGLYKSNRGFDQTCNVSELYPWNWEIIYCPNILFKL